MKRLHTSLAIATALLMGCSDDTSSTQPTEEPPWEVTVTPEDFVTGIDNPLMPLVVGASWTYEAETEDGLEVISVEVLAETKEVWGVTATVVRDTVNVDGELTEDTWDWFAQDVDGNVWYLGEETCEYEDDVCIDTGGAWEAGVDGALPGIAMLADPQVGDAYYQEYYEGEAEDYGEVVSIDASADVPAGSWSNCITTRDTTKLDPDVEELKTYCEGIGVVLEEEEDTRVELVSFSGLTPIDQ
jgi:hypothetical protein